MGCGRDAARFDKGYTAASTGVSTPVCSPSRARAHVHRLDKKIYGFGHSGVCIHVCVDVSGVAMAATRSRQRVHSDDTEKGE
jgi:hypothetical protein